MNRFLIDHHPDAIAKAMCDKHIVKMPTEEAQMLSHVLHHYLGEEGETMKEFTAELGLVNSPPAHAKSTLALSGRQRHAPTTCSVSICYVPCQRNTRIVTARHTSVLCCCHSSSTVLSIFPMDISASTHSVLVRAMTISRRVRYGLCKPIVTTTVGSIKQRNGAASTS